MSFLIEGLAFIGLIFVSLVQSKPGMRTRLSLFPHWCERALRRPFIAILLVGLLAFAASELVTVFAGIPQPRVHDEFSYLLAADTFAHARITNPPHPLWKHFESFHVIQQPTYASKYPPAQGLMLALGQVVFGHPIVGVWLSTGIACAAICWMLVGWCPLRWALMGGLLAVGRIVFSGPAFLGERVFIGYWSQSYWGGTVAAAGGALVFGALPRIMKKQRVQDSLWLALGLAILANSRPFEGLVVSIPVLIVLSIWIVRTKGISWRRILHRIGLPVVLVFLLAALWMGFYNFRVTGDPFLMPYQTHESTYGVTPVFLWQPLKSEPPYNHRSLRDFYTGWAWGWYKTQPSFAGWLWMARYKIVLLWFFFIGFLLSPFLASLYWMRRRKSVQFALGTCALLIIVLLAETYALPHYAAPATSLVFLLVVESLRQARFAKWRGKEVGQSLVRAVLPALLVCQIAWFAVERIPASSEWWTVRARIMGALEQDKNRHLVIVRYGPKHSPNAEWVYNRADIDAAKVVWAREMGPQVDRELLEYFKDRRVWLLEVEQAEWRLTPYAVGKSDK
jgi:hypothetical protein